jgi:hypothetical protein
MKYSHGFSSSWVLAGVVTFLAALVLVFPADAQDCVGDCDGEDGVTVNELIIGVNIALGNQEVSACEAFDSDGDGRVTVSELVQGVNNALRGCSSGEALGERVFTVREDSIQFEESRSAVLISLIPADFPNLASAIRAEPMRLVAGVPGEDGRAPLELAEDVLIALEVPLYGGVLCFKIDASTSPGWIDCDRGPAPDVVAVRDAGPDPNIPTELTIWGGEETGPGAAVLRAVLRANMMDALPSGSGPEACEGVEFPVIVETAFTTAMATADKGGQVQSLAGENFSCDQWTTTDGPGMLVAPIPQFHPLGGDVGVTLRLADR